MASYPLHNSSYSLAEDPVYIELSTIDPYFDQASVQSIFFTTLSLIAFLLCIPSLTWHIKNRNLPASCLIGWIMYHNLCGVINSILWPTDNFATWFLGNIYCDILVKLDVGATLGLAGALCSLIRSLAQALDTKHVLLSNSVARRMRQRIIEYLFCIGLPVYIAAIHIVVQSSRYYIFAIGGCVPAYDDAWVSVISTFIWPPVFLVLAGYYAVLVLVRVHAYRTDFAQILASTSSGLSKSRFTRLYALSFIILLVYLPLQIYVFYTNVAYPITIYDWNEVHSAETWDFLQLVPGFGVVPYDRWIRLTLGFAVFAALGLGIEATLFYKSVLVALGFGQIFPSLTKPDRRSQNDSDQSFSSTTLKNKARAFVGKLNKERRSSSSTATRTNSSTSRVGPQIGRLASVAEVQVQCDDTETLVDPSAVIMEMTSPRAVKRGPFSGTLRGNGTAVKSTWSGFLRRASGPSSSAAFAPNADNANKVRTDIKVANNNKASPHSTIDRSFAQLERGLGLDSDEDGNKSIGFAPGSKELKPKTSWGNAQEAVEAREREREYESYVVGHLV